MVCELVGILDQFEDNTRYIPELGIPEYCINHEIKAVYSLSRHWEVLELKLWRGEMDMLSNSLKCSPVDIPKKIAGMEITHPMSGKKLVINKDYAEHWEPHAFEFTEKGKPYPNTIVLKLDWAD